eukprot:scaffold2698_cov48-Phaeocystis_antarctica.AAC.1
MEMQKALSEDQDFRQPAFHPRSISSPSQAHGKQRAHNLPGGGRLPAVQNRPASVGPTDRAAIPAIAAARPWCGRAVHRKHPRRPLQGHAQD